MFLSSAVRLGQDLQAADERGDRAHQETWESFKEERQEGRWEMGRSVCSPEAEAVRVWEGKGVPLREKRK